MKVLVIGARGFIGAWLVAELQKLDIDVHCVSRGAPPVFANDHLRWRQVDHMSQQSWNALLVSEYDVIYHLGWSTVPATAEADPVSDLVENVGSGLRFLIAVRDKSPHSRLIFASSGGTIYGRTDVEKISETSVAKPISAYGVAKLAFETYLQMFRSEFGIAATSARIANPYGPGQHTTRPFGAIATFIHKAVRGEKISIFGSREILRDYLYISDVCDALIRLGRIEQAPLLVNISSGTGRSLIDVIDVLSGLLGRDVDYEVTSARRIDLQRVVLDNALLESVTGWRPKVSLEEGMRATLQDALVRIEAASRPNRRAARDFATSWDQPFSSVAATR